MGVIMKKNTVILLLFILLASSIVFAKTIKVDGNPLDWSQVAPSPNTGVFTNGEYIWRDAEYDTRNDFTEITIDGSNTDWLKLPFKYFIVTDTADELQGVDISGANLTRLYIAWNGDYLYIGLETGNTVSWDIAYGIGLDFDGKKSGYNGTSNADDAWNRKIGFNGAAIDFEIYFYWDSSTNSIMSDDFAVWTGTQWSTTPLSNIGAIYAYTSSDSGLYFLEMAIPWDAFSPYGRSNFSIIVWSTGKNLYDSAVDSVPWDPAVEDGGSSEWTDIDYLSSLAYFQLLPRYMTNDTLVDLTEFHLTSNATHLFMLFEFKDLYYVGGDGAPGIMVTIDLDNATGSGETYFGYNSDTQVNGSGYANWERQILIDLAAIPDKTHVYGDGNAVWSGGNGLDVVMVSNGVWVDVSTYNSVVIADTDNNCVEVAIAWSDLGVIDPTTASMNIEVAIVHVNPSGDAWDISGVSDVIDALTTKGPNTWDEVSDGRVDYYQPIWFNSAPEPVPEDSFIVSLSVIIVLGLASVCMYRRRAR